MPDSPTILYDGDCAYCNGWVTWIGKRDVNRGFRFISLQSPEGLALRDRYAIPHELDSVILVTKGRAYWKSTAAWRILAMLPGHRLAGQLLRVVPAPLRDLGYTLIAKNRHRLGIKDECELPR